MCSTTSIVKVNMLADAGNGHAGEVVLGGDLVGGEASFVARDAAALKAGLCAEDDGFLVTYATDNRTKESFCIIYDAATMSSTPVAKIAMPQRIPTGLHGTWVSSHDLSRQV
jgi:carotenoid cleavage dioxygenase-like enzyme